MKLNERSEQQRTITSFRVTNISALIHGLKWKLYDNQTPSSIICLFKYLSAYRKVIIVRASD